MNAVLLETSDFLARQNAWEAAWTEYIDALEYYDFDWSGENFVLDIARAAYRLDDAKRVLRSLDPDFCNALGI